MQFHTLQQTLLILALFSLGSPPCRANDEEALARQAEQLDAGLQKWAREIDFSLQYQLRQSTCPQRDVALTGKFGSKATPAVSEGTITGVLVRNQEAVRLSGTYSTGPISASADGNNFTNVSFDEAAFDEVRLLYTPKQKGLSPRVLFRPWEEEHRATSLLPHYGRTALNAYTFEGGMNQSPFRINQEEQAKTSWIVAVERVDEDHLRVTKRWEMDGGMSITRKITFWTQPSPAVVQRIDETLTLPASDVPQETTTIASEFKDCQGMAIPQKIIRVSGPLRPIGSKEFTWVAEEWTSKQLRSPAKESDFGIPLAIGTQLRGLRQPREIYQEEQLLPFHYRKVDLRQESGLAP